MSIQPRTDAVSPHELARKGGQFSGEIPLAAFPRLSSLVLGDGSVSVELGFARDEEGRSRVVGRAVLAPTLQCQRCLEPVVRQLDVAIDLRVVRTEEQAAELADQFDTFVLADDDSVDRRSGRRRPAAWAACAGVQGVRCLSEST